ncbi:hypothetical protein ACFQZO_10920 [Bradyrhizobium sp. GCM10027634]|uniref:hypothetical protein n=1 Tax=unclassified Bradyrhizobium TaxID=2631580 RepID=UPI00263B9C9C|nr:hypothetical protein [Bradyrhizobium sp. WYCCWR 12677]MDN5001395.1 hypothetical protein [Bradyrhizobium sp. WYCCWR 12677]
MIAGITAVHADKEELPIIGLKFRTANPEQEGSDSPGVLNAQQRKYQHGIAKAASRQFAIDVHLST